MTKLNTTTKMTWSSRDPRDGGVLVAQRPGAQAPWQNPYVERVIGSLRRECTDHVIVTGAAHLRRVLREYVAYYNADRTHVALDKDSPATRPVLPPGRGRVIALPRVGGLHHRYDRRAA